jgi:uncharacterized surface protein with fasciclin (FAS1) repeats
MKFQNIAKAVIVTGLFAALAAPAFATSCSSGNSDKAAGHTHEVDQASMTEMKKMDIVGTAVHAGSFNTLVAAVKAAGLVEVLQGDGPFTVFAPTDEAFAKLPEGTVEELLKPENKDKLVAILTYHVVPGSVKSTDVVKLESAETVQGQKVSINVKDGNVMVDNAMVTAVDIEATNGVIHVIDNVILPNL